jgi:uncharacterized protein (TIGR02246 family)
MRTDEQAIRDLIAQWLRASKQHDHEAVLALMSEEVVFLQPGQQPMRGRNAFAAAQKGLSDVEIDAAADIQEIRILGDWAYCWNHLNLTITPRNGGKPIKRAGPVLSILHKQDGRWLIARDANMLTLVAS